MAGVDPDHRIGRAIPNGCRNERNSAAQERCDPDFFLHFNEETRPYQGRTGQKPYCSIRSAYIARHGDFLFSPQRTLKLLVPLEPKVAHALDPLVRSGKNDPD